MKTSTDILDYNKLYNGNYKEEFINQYSSLDSQVTIYWQFLKTAESEKKLDKDLSEFTPKEIKIMLLECELATPTSANNHINTYKRYIDFMGVTPNQFLAFGNLFEFAESVCSKERERRYTKEQLLEIVDPLDIMDKALVLAIFEGVKGRSFSEICNLKEDNLKEEDNAYYAELLCDEEGERTVEISKELYKALKEANSQTYYVSPSDSNRNEVLLNESEYIFKKAKKGKQMGEKLDASFITRKFLIYKKIFNNTYLTFNDIAQSGMMHMAHELYKKNKKLGRDELLLIAEQYNISKVNTGLGYRNITKLKRYIFNRQLKKLYKELANVTYSD